MTPARGGQSGSVWANDKIDLREDFSVEAEIYLGTTDRFGADGIAFVFQPLSVNAGSSGGGLGYTGIRPSLAIEYDTWRNSADPTSFDHSSIMLNGNTGNHTQVVPFSSLGNIEDGQWHSVKITWEAATKKFTHVFDGKQLFSTNYDIVGNIFSGNPYVYWGFTAATGGAVNLQQVRFSQICSVSENPSPAIAYNDGYNFQNVTGASQPGQEVKNDQTGTEKMDPPVRGAVEKIVKDLVSLKVVANPNSNVVLGTSIGGSVFGEVFPKGTRKLVTALSNNQNSIRFESWNSNTALKIAQTSSSTSNVNPYDEFINANTIIYPSFADCGGCCPPSNPGKIGVEGDQIIDAGTIPDPLNSVSQGTLSTTGGISYQWEISQVGPNTGFTPITGADSVHYVPDSVLTDTTWYRRVAINECGGGNTSSSIVSNVVQITVNPVFESPGGGAIACENEVVIALGDNCEAIISSEAVTRPSFQDQFIYMDATHIPSSFPLNAITTRDSFY